MVVQHNLTAMNANRMLGITQGTLSKSTEKLSSGYKVNRAADDAAGLSISEKMRKQIRGLTQASANAEDGISAVQTAEGALTEVHDMLQRMNELATKAANGTNSEDDRQYIQDEIAQLTTEIDRVAETTKFNETYLLKGDGTKGTKTIAAHDAGLKGKLVAGADGKSVFTAESLKVGDTVKIGGTDYNIVESKRTDSYNSMNAFAVKKGDKLTQNGITYEVTKDATDVSAGNIEVQDSEGNDLKISVSEGATHTTSLGVTTTLVGKNGLDLSTGTITSPTTWKAGDTIVDKDGVEYTYIEAGTSHANGVGYAFSPDGIYHATDGFYKTEGSKAADTAYSAAEGDVYTIKATGETNSIVSTTANGGKNKGIVSVEDLQKAIKGLSDNDTVAIAENSNATAVTYTVGVTKKSDGSTFTADDIAALVKAGNQVNLKGDEDYYAIDVQSAEKTDISLQDAYRMMKEELEAASSIGADSKASVLHKGDGVFEITQGKVTIDNSLTFSLHVGADADMTNKIGVNIQTMSSANLGIKNLNVMDNSGKAGTYAIDAIEDAIKTVSRQRSALGAVQNRLEHTINNLDNVVENTTSAESQIRDTDMATEMVKYSNANILSQAGQSMLAQANQSNQGVLSLLG